MSLVEITSKTDNLFYSLEYNSIYSSIIYFSLSLILIWLSRIIFKLFNRKTDIDDELVEKDNLSFSLANMGYYIGVLMCAGGNLIGESSGITLDSLMIITYGLGGILLLNIGMIINDKIIFNKFSIHDEITEKLNVSVGVVVAANYVASGLIILGTLVGEGGNLWLTLSIWLLGQFILLLCTFLYDLITPYKIHEHIKEGNIAVGVGYAGAVIAFGYLIFFSIQEDFVSYEQYGLNVLIYTGLGVVLLPVVRVLTDRILLPGRKLTDEIVHQEKPNVGAAFLELFSYIGGAVLISWCL
jgi:uncharacterized membrane protein YjfL (UPF0719 family)